MPRGGSSAADGCCAGASAALSAVLLIAAVGAAAAAIDCIKAPSDASCGAFVLPVSWPGRHRAPSFAASRSVPDLRAPARHAAPGPSQQASAHRASRATGAPAAHQRAYRARPPPLLPQRATVVADLNNLCSAMHFMTVRHARARAHAGAPHARALHAAFAACWGMAARGRGRNCHPRCCPPPSPQGCSLYKACNATSPANVGSDPALCDPFQQLATICARDAGMGGMSGCVRYKSMCANGSRVPACKAERGFDLMSTADANKWVGGAST